MKSSRRFCIPRFLFCGKTWSFNFIHCFLHYIMPFAFAGHKQTTWHYTKNWLSVFFSSHFHMQNFFRRAYAHKARGRLLRKKSIPCSFKGFIVNRINFSNFLSKYSVGSACGWLYIRRNKLRISSFVNSRFEVFRKRGSKWRESVCHNNRDESKNAKPFI